MHEWADSGGEGNDHGVKEVHLVVLSCWVGIPAATYHRRM